MFVVYSPEGRSFIGESQAIPTLKVDPSTKVSGVEENVLDGIDIESDQHPAAHKESAAIHAYLTNQKDKNRRVVVKVSEIMSAPVEMIDRENSIEEAWLQMKDGAIAHLPVMHDGRLVGICSQTDLLGRVIVDSEGGLEGVKLETVADIMTTQVVTTQASTDIRHVAMVLTEYQIGALVIMNEFEEPIGIVTRGDLIKRLATDPPVELYI